MLHATRAANVGKAFGVMGPYEAFRNYRNICSKDCNESIGTLGLLYPNNQPSDLFCGDVEYHVADVLRKERSIHEVLEHILYVFYMLETSNTFRELIRHVVLYGNMYRSEVEVEKLKAVGDAFHDVDRVHYMIRLCMTRTRIGKVKLLQSNMMYFWRNLRLDYGL